MEVSAIKTALFVIDMQNDYLWEKRKSRFNCDTAKLTGAVNDLIRRYAAQGSDVIYIRHTIQNLPNNRLLFGCSLAGTEGAAKRGIKARILREGTATVMSEGKAAKMKAKLQAAKIEYI